MVAPMDQALGPGLYIVATPIGNLGDLSRRGAAVLGAVAAVACEDTRVTGKLMQHVGVKARLIRYDDHASDATCDYIVALAAEQAVALVSDAGTPLISDPGYKLVRAARERGIAVTSIPGPSAAIVALTLAGLPSDRFLFAGFLPSKAKARADALAELATIKATLVFYETAPRLTDALSAIGEVLPGREVAVARELTKLYEECRSGSADELIAHYSAHPPRGEIVLVIAPPGEVQTSAADADLLLAEALKSQKPSRAAAEVARATGLDRKVLYARAMEMK
jgi:16S rRNA (cytidine1402-2'-O)-methyltransferase